MLHLSDNSNDLDVPQIRIEGRENVGDTVLDIAVRDAAVRLNLVEGSVDAAAGFGQMIFKTNAAANTSNPTRGGFLFSTLASANNLVITNTGNVGIGTATPETLLHVEKSSTALYTSSMSGLSSYTPSDADMIQVRNSKTGLNDIYAGIWFETGTGATNTTGSDRAGRIALVVDNDSAYSANFVFQTRGTNAQLSEKMRITGAGNVGIGTDAPDGKFVVSNSGAEGIEFFPGSTSNQNTTQHYNRSGSAYVKNRTIALNHEWVNGSTDPAMNLIPDGNSTFLVVKAKASTYSSTANLSLYGTNPSLNGGSLVSRATIQAQTDGTAFGTKLSFFTNNTSNVETKAVTIDATQNVGIGTTGPQVPLDIMPDSSKRVFGSQQNSTQHGFCEYIISGTIGANAVTITMQCPSYFQAEVVATFQQSNGGTDMNVYYNGIWSNNHTTHLFKNKTNGGTVPRIGGPLSQNPTYSVGVGDAASNTGKLIFTKAAHAGTSGTYCIHVRAYGYGCADMTYVVS
jgi:hypothetical protein